jgi:hypothetical protein
MARKSRVQPEIEKFRVTDTERSKEYEIGATQARVFGTFKEIFMANGASQDDPVTKPDEKS